MNPFYLLFFRAAATDVACSVLVDLSAVSAIMRLDFFKVALLIGDEWQHMSTRAYPEETPSAADDEQRYGELVDNWKAAREKLHNPLYVGNVSYAPTKGV